MIKIPFYYGIGYLSNNRTSTASNPWVGANFKSTWTSLPKDLIVFLKKLPSTLTYVFHSQLIVYYIDKIQNNAMPSLLLHIITICSLICYFMIMNEWLNSFVWFLLSVIILGNVAKFPLRIFPTNTWIWKPSIPHFEIISTVPLYCHNM